MSVTLERVSTATKPPERPAYSAHGYVITEDGTTYAQHYQHYHGVILALLYPQALKDFRFGPDGPSGYQFDDEGRMVMDPDDGECALYGRLERLTIPADREDINVFHFQAFELAVHAEFPVIRICPSRMSSDPSFDVPRFYPVTPAQLQALRLVGQVLGYDRTTEVCTDHGDLKWPKFLEWCQTREPETRAPKADDAR